MEKVGNSFELYDGKNNWIPCSEELPEKDGTYLCTILSEENKPFIGICDFENKKWYLEKRDVTAWRPLPEPYEEQEPDCFRCIHNGVDHCKFWGGEFAKGFTCDEFREVSE